MTFLNSSDYDSQEGVIIPLLKGLKLETTKRF